MNYYEIKFNGIKDGSHSNSFEIKDKFFDTFENSEIKQAEIIASTTLNKQENKITLDIILSGTVNNISCDICTEKIDIPISSKMNFIVKEGEENNIYNEDVIIVDALENTICLKNYFYEMITLALPTKRQHKFNATNNIECNKEMINLIEKYSYKNNEIMDPRWEALNDIKLK
jgi:uncharacterized metal-binding protein YceD (DUF177 family)